MKNYFMLIVSFLIMSQCYAQIGINTVTPQASLHISESSRSSPSGNDGILVPVINNFPEVEPVEEGSLVHLRKVDGVSTTTSPDGFYYWKDGEWIQIITRLAAIYEYSNIYCVYGQGYEGQSNVPKNEYRKILFTDLVYNASKELPGNEFSLSNNSLIIGKSGFYLASLVTGARKNGESLSTQQNSNIAGEILVNGQPYTPSGLTLTAMAAGSSSVESITASQLVLNVLVKLNKGDVVNARVRQEDVRDGNGNLSSVQAFYTNSDISTLTLTYIYN